MKKNKILPILLSAAMLFTACGNNTADNKDGAKEETAKVESFKATEAGHNGDIEATVNFEGDKIASIDLVHKETEGLGDEAANKIVKEIVDKQSINVDTVSGATVTSTALIEAIKAAIEESGQTLSFTKRKRRSQQGNRN